LVDIQLDENNCTRIANELLEAMTRVSMGAYEWRVFLTLILKTYGINSKYFALNPTIIAAVSGIPLPGVSRALKALEKHKMIGFTWAKRKKWIYIQKDYDLWGTNINIGKFIADESNLTNQLNVRNEQEDGTYRDISKEVFINKLKES